MNWKVHYPETLAIWLRFVVRGCLLVSAIAASFAATFLCVKLCYRFAEWFNMTALSHPW